MIETLILTKLIIISNKTDSNITNLLKIKSKMFKQFKGTNDKFWLMCDNFYYYYYQIH